MNSLTNIPHIIYNILSYNFESFMILPFARLIFVSSDYNEIYNSIVYNINHNHDHNMPAVRVKLPNIGPLNISYFNRSINIIVNLSQLAQLPAFLYNQVEVLKIDVVDLTNSSLMWKLKNLKKVELAVPCLLVNDSVTAVVISVEEWSGIEHVVFPKNVRTVSGFPEIITKINFANNRNIDKIIIARGLSIMDISKRDKLVADDSIIKGLVNDHIIMKRLVTQPYITEIPRTLVYTNLTLIDMRMGNVKILMKRFMNHDKLRFMFSVDKDIICFENVKTESIYYMNIHIIPPSPNMKQYKVKNIPPSLPNLYELQITGNEVFSDTLEFSYMPKLKILNCHGSKTRGHRFIGNMLNKAPNVISVIFSRPKGIVFTNNSVRRAHIVFGGNAVTPSATSYIIFPKLNYLEATIDDVNHQDHEAERIKYASKNICKVFYRFSN